MSTRGFVGFVVDGTEKIAYNHSDSYPDWLGVRVLAWARTQESWRAVREEAKRLQVVEDEEDVYQELRHLHGDLGGYLKEGRIPDAHNFPMDSLFAEWGYIVDLDGDGAFEVYRGFQTDPPKQGRWAGRRQGDPDTISGKYAACERVASYPIGALPTDAQFLADLAEPDGD